jgi:hypothetical protein
MIRSAFNLQEVLSPLMARYGRRLQGERGETYEKIVVTVCEALDVERETGAHLVAALSSARLIDFERTDQPEVILMVQGESQSHGYSEDSEKQYGVWCLGPRL